jgi:hypothetical protein
MADNNFSIKLAIWETWESTNKVWDAMIYSLVEVEKTLYLMEVNLNKGTE